jgi:hypothetical protein
MLPERTQDPSTWDSSIPGGYTPTEDIPEIRLAPPSVLQSPREQLFRLQVEGEENYAPMAEDVDPWSPENQQLFNEDSDASARERSIAAGTLRPSTLETERSWLGKQAVGFAGGLAETGALTLRSLAEAGIISEQRAGYGIEGLQNFQSNIGMDELETYYNRFGERDLAGWFAFHLGQGAGQQVPLIATAAAAAAAGLPVAPFTFANIFLQTYGAEVEQYRRDLRDTNATEEDIAGIALMSSLIQSGIENMFGAEAFARHLGVKAAARAVGRTAVDSVGRMTLRQMARQGIRTGGKILSQGFGEGSEEFLQAYTHDIGAYINDPTYKMTDPMDVLLTQFAAAVPAGMLFGTMDVIRTKYQESYKKTLLTESQALDEMIILSKMNEQDRKEFQGAVLELADKLETLPNLVGKGRIVADNVARVSMVCAKASGMRPMQVFQSMRMAFAKQNYMTAGEWGEFTAATDEQKQKWLEDNGILSQVDDEIDQRFDEEKERLAADEERQLEKDLAEGQESVSNIKTEGVVTPSGEVLPPTQTADYEHFQNAVQAQREADKAKPPEPEPAPIKTKTQAEAVSTAAPTRPITYIMTDNDMVTTPAIGQEYNKLRQILESVAQRKAEMQQQGQDPTQMTMEDVLAQALEVSRNLKAVRAELDQQAETPVQKEIAKATQLELDFEALITKYSGSVKGREETVALFDAIDKLREQGRHAPVGVEATLRAAAREQEAWFKQTLKRSVRSVLNIDIPAQPGEQTFPDTNIPVRPNAWVPLSAIPAAWFRYLYVKQAMANANGGDFYNSATGEFLIPAQLGPDTPVQVVEAPSGVEAATNEDVTRELERRRRKATLVKRLASANLRRQFAEDADEIMLRHTRSPVLAAKRVLSAKEVIERDGEPELYFYFDVPVKNVAPGYHELAPASDEGRIAAKYAKYYAPRTYLEGPRGSVENRGHLNLVRHEVKIDPKKLYDYRGDPDNLDHEAYLIFSQAVDPALTIQEKAALYKSIYEQQIKKAGYSGFFNTSDTGDTVAVFETVEAKPMEATIMLKGVKTKRLSLQLSTETRQGTSIKTIPEWMEKASYDELRDFDRWVHRNALTDNQGNDRLAQALGLRLFRKMEGVDDWKNQNNPTTQLVLEVNPETDFDEKGELLPSLVTRLNVYCNAFGYLTKQDSVGWHIAKFKATDTVDTVGGGEIAIGIPGQERTITIPEIKALKAELAKLGFSDPAVIASAMGVRLLYRGDNKAQFHKAVEKAALKTLTVDMDYSIFGFESNLEENNWSTEGGANGEIYIQRIKEAGRSDIQGMLDSIKTKIDAELLNRGVNPDRSIDALAAIRGRTQDAVGNRTRQVVGPGEKLVAGRDVDQSISGVRRIVPAPLPAPRVDTGIPLTEPIPSIAAQGTASDGLPLPALNEMRQSADYARTGENIANIGGREVKLTLAPGPDNVLTWTMINPDGKIVTLTADSEESAIRAAQHEMIENPPAALAAEQEPALGTEIVAAMYLKKHNLAVFFKEATPVEIIHEFFHHLRQQGLLPKEVEDALLKATGEKGWNVKAEEAAVDMFLAYLEKGQLPKGLPPEAMQSMEEIRAIFGEQAHLIKKDGWKLNPEVEALFQQLFAAAGRYPVKYPQLTKQIAEAIHESVKSEATALHGERRFNRGMITEFHLIRKKFDEIVGVDAREVLRQVGQKGYLLEKDAKAAGVEQDGDMTSSELKDAIKFLSEHPQVMRAKIEEGRKAQEKAIKVEFEQERKLTGAVLEAQREGRHIEANNEAVALKEQLQQQPESVEMRTRNHGGPAWLAGIRKVIKTVGNYVTSPENYFKMLDGGDENGPFSTAFWKRIWDNTSEHARRISDAQERLNSRILALGGVPDNLHDEVAIKDKGATKRFTIAELVGIYMHSHAGDLASDSAKALKENNPDITDTVIREAVLYVENQNVKAMNLVTLITGYMQETQPILARVASKVLGRSIGDLGRFYLPFVYKNGNIGEVNGLDLLEGLDMKGPDIKSLMRTPAQVRERQKGIRGGALELDALKLFLRYMDSSENYIAKAESTQHMLWMLHNAGFAQEIQSRFGGDALRVISEMVTRELSPTGRIGPLGLGEGTLQMLRGRAYQSFLSLNPFTVMKQPVSILNALAMMPRQAVLATLEKFTGMMLKSTASGFSLEGFMQNEEFQRMIDESPVMRLRAQFGLTDPEMDNLFRQRYSSSPIMSSIPKGRLTKLLSTGLNGIRLFDMISVTAVYSSARNVALSEGKSMKEAIAYAEKVIRKTQSPTTVAERTLMQTSNEYVKSAILFSGQLFNNLNQYIYDIVIPILQSYKAGGLAAGIKTLWDKKQMIIYAGLLPSMVLGVIARRRPQKNEKEIFLDLLAYPLQAFPFIGAGIARGFTGFDPQGYQAVWLDLVNGISKTVAQYADEDKSLGDPELLYKDVKRMERLALTYFGLPQYPFRVMHNFHEEMEKSGTARDMPEVVAMVRATLDAEAKVK